MIPTYWGGTSDPENIALACKACNEQRGSSRSWPRRSRGPVLEVVELTEAHQKAWVRLQDWLATARPGLAGRRNRHPRRASSETVNEWMDRLARL